MINISYFYLNPFFVYHKYGHVRNRTIVRSYERPVVTSKLHTSHFTLQTSHYTLYRYYVWSVKSSKFKLHTSHFIDNMFEVWSMWSLNFTLHTSHVILHISFQFANDVRRFWSVKFGSHHRSFLRSRYSSICEHQKRYFNLVHSQCWKYRFLPVFIKSIVYLLLKQTIILCFIDMIHIIQLLLMG